MAMMTYVDAIRDAQRQEMLRDPDVFIAGEDVALMGSSFGQTAGLYQEFGAERVLDTPISEGQIVSLGVGAAHHRGNIRCRDGVRISRHRNAHV